MVTQAGSTVMPPDGGWGWAVVGAAFIAHVLTHGIVYSFGVLFIAIQDTFHGSKAEIAWISSTCTGALYLIGPLAGNLCDRYGFMVVTIVGSCLAAAGHILSVFATNLYVLYLTLGIMAGCGIGMVFLPSIVVVTKYFRVHRAAACGLAIAGCGVGAFVFSPLLTLLVHTYGWRGCLLILGGLLLNCIPCGLIYRPLPESQTSMNQQQPSNKVVRLETTALLHPSNEDVTRKDKSTTDSEIRKDAAKRWDDLELRREEVHMDRATNTLCLNSTEALGSVIIAKAENDESADLGTLSSSPEHFKDTCDIKDGYVQQPHIEDERKKVVFEMSPNCESCGEGRPSGDGIWHHLTICANSVFLIFLLSQFLFFLGFYFPFVYVPDRVKSIGMDETSGVWAVSTIGLSSIGGRVLLGHVADSPRVNRILMFKVMLMITGLSTALGPLCNNKPLLFTYACVYGVSTGTTLSLTSVVLVDLLGIAHLNNAFGITTFVSGVASLVGPPLAGLLTDATNSYDIAFIVVGCVMALSGGVMFVQPVCDYIHSKVTK